MLLIWMKNNGTRGCVVETCPNQFNGKRPKNLEIKVKKPGALGKNLLMYWWHQEELKAVDENKVSIYLCFLPFWHSGQNVSWCNKLVTMCLVNQSIKSSLELRIFTALVPKNQFYKTNKNIQGKCIPLACESICLEIFVPYFETVRLSWVSQQNCDTWEVWSCL